MWCIVCVILCLAVLVEHRLVTDTEQTDTDTGPWHAHSAGLSPRVAPCQNLRGGAHSTISVLIIEKS